MEKMEDEMTGITKKDEPQMLPADPMISMIERMAMDPNSDITKLERMLEMKERMEAKEAERAFSSDFAAMQAELPIIKERGAIRNRNGEVQSTYPLWEDVISALREPLAAHGFSMSFDRRKEDGVTYYGCILMHRMGHSQRVEIDLPRDASGSKNEVQGEGSTVSYGQRYSSKMAINWISEHSEDDDGARAGAGDTISLEQYDALCRKIEAAGVTQEIVMQAEKLTMLELMRADRFEPVMKRLQATIDKKAGK